jgi:hypothetical protein
MGIFFNFLLVCKRKTNFNNGAKAFRKTTIIRVKCHRRFTILLSVKGLMNCFLHVIHLIAILLNVVAPYKDTISMESMEDNVLDSYAGKQLS